MCRPRCPTLSPLWMMQADGGWGPLAPCLGRAANRQRPPDRRRQEACTPSSARPPVELPAVRYLLCPSSAAHAAPGASSHRPKTAGQHCVFLVFLPPPPLPVAFPPTGAVKAAGHRLECHTEVTTAVAAAAAVVNSWQCRPHLAMTAAAAAAVALVVATVAAAAVAAVAAAAAAAMVTAARNRRSIHGLPATDHRPRLCVAPAGGRWTRRFGRRPA